MHFQIELNTGFLYQLQNLLAEKFEGYTLIRTYTAKNGDIIHLYRKNVPNTGDSANIALFEAMLAMSALGLAALAIAKRKHS